MTNLKPVRVGLDPAVAGSAPEIKYVFRTLLRVAGLPWHFVWARDAGSGGLDIYYGPRKDIAARVSIRACGRSFAALDHVEPEALREENGVPVLDFGERQEGRTRGFQHDIVFGSYWLLAGSRETQYARDRWDNLDLSGSAFLKESLAARPLVSLYGALLRRQFGGADLPWMRSGSSAAFVFTHDVDYPEIIRWIECLRLIRSRGLAGLESAAGVVRGTNHFWKFADWVEFEKRLCTRPTFYFMARRGSLIRYALGTPDAFYDIEAPAFRRLFRQLSDEGCEIGLHASYHAHRSGEDLVREKEKLERAAGVEARGNRHHYWHLDPAAPNATLKLHEQAGLVYDSSLGLEFYPGFRRGICHPFRVFDAAERRELRVLQIPPAWMDDHFDRRLARNGIADTEAYALGLVKAASDTGGVVVVDYHARGMNADFYPRYGAWLMRFVERNLGSSIAYRTPGEIAREYLEYENRLEAASMDYAVDQAAVVASSPADAIEVDLLRAGEEDAWERFVDAHPRGAVYHTLAWRAVTEEGLGHTSYFLRAVDRSGRLAGVLPLFLVRGIKGRRLVSVPMRDRGGLLADSREAAEALVKRAIELTRELDCKYLELRSLDELDPEVARKFGLASERRWITTRVDLTPGVDPLWKALDRDAVRWAIRKASREGVSFEFDSTPAGVDLFYELFARARGSMGIPVFPKELFLAIWRRLISCGRASLAIVRKDGTPINAMISLHSKDTFIPAYAAPQNEWRKSYPSEVMFWNTIEWAATHGFRCYDFGADSPRQNGLLKFKRKWGGVQHAMSYSYFLNGPSAPPDLDSSSPAYSAMRKIWSRLPLQLSKPLGSWVTRQLS